MHDAAAAVAAMISDPKSIAKREAAVDALAAAPDDEFDATMKALIVAFPTRRFLMLSLDAQLRILRAGRARA